MTVARFIADQRTRFRVPHAACCRLLGMSVSWFYKWQARASTGTLTVSETRRQALDDAVALAFEKAKGRHGSPRLLADLRDAGWTVSREDCWPRRCDDRGSSRARSDVVATQPGPTRPASRSLTCCAVISPPVARTSAGLGT